MRLWGGDDLDSLEHEAATIGRFKNEINSVPNFCQEFFFAGVIVTMWDLMSAWL